MFETVFRAAFGAALVLPYGSFAVAQARRMADLNPNGTSAPSYFTQVGNQLYFSARSASGRQLYRTTGSRATLVSSAIRNAVDLTAFGSKVIFRGSDGGSTGEELYISGGTSTTTKRLKDIMPGLFRSGFPKEFTTAGSRCFFTASDGTHGRELWVTDGTSSGTRMVRDIRSGRLSSDPKGLTRLGTRIVFSAFHPSFGREIWISDGTSNGTRMLSDIMRGTSSSDPDHLSEFKGQVYFAATNATSRRLYRTDGTSFRTVSWFSGVVPSSPIVQAGSFGYFRGTNSSTGTELWRLDGNFRGVKLMKDIEPGRGSSSPFDLTAVGSRLFFTAQTAQHGRELYYTTGFTTQLIKDINPGRASGIHTAIQTLRLIAPVSSSRVAFAGTDANNDTELWISDGTTGGTYRAQDLFRGGSSRIGELTVIGRNLVFAATDESGNEPWFVPSASICCGSSIDYGRGCQGTGFQFHGCGNHNSNGGELTGGTKRLKTEFAMHVPAISRIRLVAGFEVYTESLVSPSAEMVGSIYHAHVDFPRPRAAASGKVVLGEKARFYRVMFPQPVRINAREPFFITVDLDVARMPTVRSGSNLPAFTRDRSSTKWQRLSSVKTSFRILCRDTFPAQPRLSAPAPQLGTPWTAEVSGAVQRSAAILFVGSSDRQWGPLSLPFDLAPLGAAGCRLLTSAELLLPTTTDDLGLGTVSLPMPSAHDLLGTQFHAQWLVVDPQANALGAALSHARRLVLGH